MKTIDLGSIFVGYNFVIGVLLMLASQRTARYVAVLGMGAKAKVERYTHVALRTFGQAVAALSGSIYVIFYLLRLGVN
jgi:hypothetical protein